MSRLIRLVIGTAGVIVVVALEEPGAASAERWRADEWRVPRRRA